MKLLAKALNTLKQKKRKNFLEHQHSIYNLQLKEQKKKKRKKKKEKTTTTTEQQVGKYWGCISKLLYDGCHNSQ